jgi:diguanylate cyclase (GGDEF)-like protein
MPASIDVPNVWTNTVGTLPSHSVHVTPSTPTKVAVEALKLQPDLPGVLIDEAEACLGMVSRQSCYELLSHPFGIDLFLKRPIWELYQTSPCLPTHLPAETPVAEAVQLALGRPAQQRYEPIIVDFANHTHKLLDMHVLLLAQSQLLSRANHLIEQQEEIGRALSSTLELKEVLNLILENMARLVDYDQASILLQHAETLELAAARGVTITRPEKVRVPIRVNDLYWRLCQSRRPLLLTQVATPAAWVSAEWSPAACSWLGIPLVHANEVIGMLSLARAVDRPYEPEILPLAETFAAQAAIALQNARLFDEVQQLATTDSLTQLFNRRHFYRVAEREFERALRYNRPLSLLILDVDLFKRVNDTYGHTIGDQVLQTIAARCQAALRDVDLVARYGGEEFIVLMPETTAADVPATAERLRRRIAEATFSADEHELSVTVSVGAASLDAGGHGLTLPGLIDRADQALYYAKRTGRNRVSIWDRSTSGEMPSATGAAYLRPREPSAHPPYEPPGPNPSAWTALAAVQRVSTTMRAAQAPEMLLPGLLDEILTELKCEAGAIWLHDPALGQLELTLARGWLTQLKDAPIRPGQGIVGLVFATSELYATHEFASDYHLSQTNAAVVPAGWSGLCVPMCTAGENIGVLCVSMPLPREVTALETRLLTTLAEMAGNALHRMRLHTQTEQQLKRLTALRAIDTAIAGSHNLASTLNLLLEQLISLLDVHAAAILMCDAQTQVLCYAAGRGFRTGAISQARVPVGQGYAGRAAQTRQLVQVANLADCELPEAFADFVATEGFVAYYAVPLLTKGQVTGVLEVFHRSALNLDPAWLDYLQTLGGQAAIAIGNTQLFENLQRSNAELAQAYDATLESWDRMLELRDQETEGHAQRVVAMTLRLGCAMGLCEAELVVLRRGALLHDIGKMGTPDSILLKPGPLTAEEQAIMQLHPIYAYELLAGIDFLRPALDIPYCHHEKWDGTGYPRQLRGEQIPLSARIFAVVDVWDALCSDRPYRRAWPVDRVRQYIQDEAGRHFDPAVVQAFFQHLGGLA